MCHPNRPTEILGGRGGGYLAEASSNACDYAVYVPSSVPKRNHQLVMVAAAHLRRRVGKGFRVPFADCRRYMYALRLARQCTMHTNGSSSWHVERISGRHIPWHMCGFCICLCSWLALPVLVLVLVRVLVLAECVVSVFTRSITYSCKWIPLCRRTDVSPCHEDEVMLKNEGRKMVGILLLPSGIPWHYDDVIIMSASGTHIGCPVGRREVPYRGVVDPDTIRGKQFHVLVGGPVHPQIL
jgi:hypothetical protein